VLQTGDLILAADQRSRTGHVPLCREPFRLIAGFPRLIHGDASAWCGIGKGQDRADRPHTETGIERGRRSGQDLKVAGRFVHHASDLFDAAGTLLDPDDVGMRGQLHHHFDRQIDPGVDYFAKMTTAYRERRSEDFNKSVSDYRNWLAEKSLAPELKKGAEETLFNHLEPFYKSMVIYVVALLLGCAFWLNLSEPVRRAAFQLLVLAFVIHTLGLVFRMYLERRPPVTNLYSSAIFVGWGAVILGIILERIFRGGVGIVAAATFAAS